MCIRDRNLIRDTALKTPFVDVKVCAIDETWSGLKLVVRKELRASFALAARSAAAACRIAGCGARRGPACRRDANNFLA